MKKTEELIRFQVEESKLHPLVSGEPVNFDHLQQQMNQLRLIHYHVSNIENIYIEKSSFLIKETDLLTSATRELREYISSNNAEKMEEYEKKDRKSVV